MSNNHPTYQAFHDYLKQVKHVEHVAGIANWDQEVHMPQKGHEFRAQQLAYLSGWHHQLLTDGKLEGYLEQLRQDDSLTESQKRNVAAVDRDLAKTKKLPTEFVQRMSQAVSEANQAWSRAREGEDFTIFSPKLKELVALNQEKARYYGYQDHIYDALLDDFEPGLTTKAVDQVMGQAKQSLTSLLSQINQQPAPEMRAMQQRFPQEQQLALSRQLAREVGFDFEAGGLSISEHPFTTSFSPLDVRITTRFFENDLPESIGSTIHEAGHALYEQGLLPENYGLPAGEAISLGIHESQSRLWENNIGRSRAFIRAYLPVFKQYFPEQLGAIGEAEFYRAFNQVQPSLIRTAADEVTYHLHILIRTELEKALLEERLSVDELPEAWNQAYRDYLGITPGKPSEGVLQDIHWSHGAIGYFPTYSLGSFYAAQFYHQAQQDMPDLHEQIEQRNLQPLLQWLRENLHQHGRLYQASEICEAITGEPLNFQYFEQYLYQKYQDIYYLA